MMRHCTLYIDQGSNKSIRKLYLRFDQTPLLVLKWLKSQEGGGGGGLGR